MTANSPTILIVLDGWGHRESAPDNAISNAKTPVWDRLWRERPSCLISGSGLAVGLPEGQMGNSEVGHMNLGAGRLVDQDYTRINKAIEDGTFMENKVLRQTMRDIAAKGGALHLFGLLSPGGVHSHENHITATIDMARVIGLRRVYLHAFLDGRDVPPKSAKASITKVQRHISAGGDGSIASIIGRYYAMDRDNRWDRVELAYQLITDGNANYVFDDPVKALMAGYKRGETDEFIAASAIRPQGECIKLEDGDGVIYMNFRADRARQLSRAFVGKDFKNFRRNRIPKLSNFVSLTEYAIDIPSEVAFSPAKVSNSLGEYVASLGMKQLRIAETEKYAHVTFFFSGGRESPFHGESRILIPSPDVETYDLKPEMSAPAITDALVEAIKLKQYSLIICNYANGDMVGHTGNFDAAIKAVECLDACLGRVIKTLESTGGQCLITADHGNVEQMLDKDSAQVHTAHTSLDVPLIYIGPQELTFRSAGGVLSDVAPTIVELMKLKLPNEMTGSSLISELEVGKATT